MKRISKVETPIFKETGFHSAVTEFSFALAAFRGNEFLPSGTAITLRSNFLITAKHVIEDYQSKFEGGNSKTKKNAKLNFDMVAVQGINAGKSAALWKVIKIWKSELTDIAFLLVEPFSKEAMQYRWRSIVVDLSPPEIGTQISAFGYHNPQINVIKKGANWDFRPMTSAGEIKEIFWERRDSSFLNFSCVQTDVRFGSSMSGGPVFNEKGFLCGLICADLEDGTDNAHSVSYYSLLWPSLVTKLDVNRQGFPPDTSYFILDLIRAGMIKAIDFERVTITTKGNDTAINYNFKATSV